MKSLLSFLRKTTPSFLVFIALFVLISNATSQSILELSNRIEKLTGSSDLVIEGIPIESVSYWNADNTNLFTDYKVSVQSIL